MKVIFSLKRIRRNIAILLTALMLFASGATAASAAVHENTRRPVIDAKSAALYSVTTDEMLYAKNPDQRVEPWSTTKLMTALVVAETMDLNQEVTVSKKAASMGGSTMNLVAGEKVTVRQLMYGLLLESGNDAAYALGQADGDGSIKIFAAKMNARAKKLGCRGTHFVNPNGLKAKNHYTTAADYVKIARAALANKTVFKIAGTKVYHMDATNKSHARTLETHLDLIEKKGSGVVAGKTGYWEDDDCSVALMYDKKGLKMILVQFGANMETRAKDGAKLLKFGTEKIVTKEATNPKKSAGNVRVKYGARTLVKTYAKGTVLTYPKDGSADSISVKENYKDVVKAPLKSGDKVGTLEVYCDGRKVGSTPLVVHENIEKGWFLSRFYISNRATIAIGVILMLLALIIGFLVRRRKDRKAEEMSESGESKDTASAESKEEIPEESLKSKDIVDDHPEDRYL